MRNALLAALLVLLPSISAAVTETKVLLQPHSSAAVTTAPSLAEEQDNNESCGAHNASTGLCLTNSFPILKKLPTTDNGQCCSSCVADPQCVSWNTNTQQKICYLRGSYVPGPHKPECTSGRVRQQPKPPPPPPPSDQRPRFHLMPRQYFTNDVQGPFYDPRHKRFHVGFAWHYNGTHGIGSAPNRWYHVVSDDLARWRVVSTTPSRAMISPDQPYDSAAAMTGSVTVVDGLPSALYSCRSAAMPDVQHIALAWAANESDPDLVKWDKLQNNPIISHPRRPTAGFRDPSTAWLGGANNRTWFFALACADCYGDGKSSAALYASTDFRSWRAAGALMNFTSMIECPDFFDALPRQDINNNDEGGKYARSSSSGGSDALQATTATVRQRVLKYNQHGREYAVVGPYDSLNQRFIRLENSGVPRLLDGGGVYASKSFYDSVHDQQVYLAWVHEGWMVNGGCVNSSVCSTHTLPRAVIWDKRVNQLRTPPIPQLAKLRIGDPLVQINTPRTIAPLEHLWLPDVRGMQLEITATFALQQQQQHDVEPADYNAYTNANAPDFGLVVRADENLTQQVRASVFGCNNSSCQIHAGLNNSAAAIVPKPCAGPSAAPISLLCFGGSHDMPLLENERNITLTVFVDHSIVEVYGTDGRAVVTTRTYPLDSADHVAIFAGAKGAQLLKLTAWRLDSAWLPQTDS